MFISKLVVFFSALILASFIGSAPVDAAVAPLCTSAELAAGTFDCDGDGLSASGGDLTPLCNDLTPGDCDGDGIPDASDPCNDLDPAADCDGDNVANELDQCLETVAGEDLVVGACTIPGLDTILPTGCSLTEALVEGIEDCADGARNHGKFVSCVAKLTNALKKQKIITGAQKGQIQSCAARTDIGKTPRP